MTDFLRVGGAPLRVLEGSFKWDQHERQGFTDRTADMTLVSSERTPKMRFSCQALFLTVAEHAAFLDTISVLNEPGIPEPVYVDSDADGGTQGNNWQMLIWMTSAEPFVYLDGGTEKSAWVAALTFRQV